MLDFASNELFLKLLIRCLYSLDQLFKPIIDELTIFFSSNEVVLIAELPCYLRVHDWIDLPLERASVVRMEKHEYLRFLSITIEN